MSYVSEAKIVLNPKRFNRDFLKNIGMGEKFLSKTKVYTKISENEFLSYPKKYAC